MAFEIICAYIVSSFSLELNRYNHKKVPTKRARKVIKTNQIVHISFVDVCEHFLNINVIQDCSTLTNSIEQWNTLQFYIITSHFKSWIRQFLYEFCSQILSYCSIRLILLTLKMMSHSTCYFLHRKISPFYSTNPMCYFQDFFFLEFKNLRLQREISLHSFINLSTSTGSSYRIH